MDLPVGTHHAVIDLVAPAVLQRVPDGLRPGLPVVGVYEGLCRREAGQVLDRDPK